MVDKLHVMVVKPKFVGMQEQERIENRRNLVGTALGATAVIGGMAIANEIAGTQRGISIGNSIAKSRPVTATAGYIDKAKTAVAAQFEKPGILKKIADGAKNVKNYFMAMPKSVRYIGTAALATVGLLHIYDKGRIKDKFEGYHSANELADKASETIGHLVDKTAELLGLKNQQS